MFRQRVFLVLVIVTLAAARPDNSLVVNAEKPSLGGIFSTVVNAGIDFASQAAQSAGEAVSAIAAPIAKPITAGLQTAADFINPVNNAAGLSGN